MNMGLRTQVKKCSFFSMPWARKNFQGKMSVNRLFCRATLRMKPFTVDSESPILDFIHTAKHGKVGDLWHLKTMQSY